LELTSMMCHNGVMSSHQLMSTHQVLCMRLLPAMHFFFIETDDRDQFQKVK